MPGVCACYCTNSNRRLNPLQMKSSGVLRDAWSRCGCAGEERASLLLHRSFATHLPTRQPPPAVDPDPRWRSWVGGPGGSFPLLFARSL